MKLLKILAFILIMYVWAPTVHGDIYSWTDQHGIIHFTNYSPPPEAKVLIKDAEMSHSDAVDHRTTEIENENLARQQNESQEDLEKKLQEVNRRVEELEDTLENAEALTEDLDKKLLTANKKAREARENAEALANEDSTEGPQYSSDVIYLNVRSYGPGYYPYRGYYKGHGPKINRKHHSSRKHLKKHHRGPHHKYHKSGRYFTKSRPAGIHQNGHFGGRHSKKHHGGSRHNHRSSVRHFRR